MHAAILRRIEEGAGALGVALDARQVDLLGSYLDLLDRWARRINLTGLRTPEERADRLVIESLAARPSIEEGARTAVDVGSGAGVPGVPLQIVMPGCVWALVEPRLRRAVFLREVTHRLNLPARVIEARAQDLSERFDVAASRAWKSPDQWWAIARGLTRPGGTALAWAREALGGFGGEVRPYVLPGGDRGVVLADRFTFHITV